MGVIVAIGLVKGIRAYNRTQSMHIFIGWTTAPLIAALLVFAGVSMPHYFFAG
ncbi:hypothetical protein JXA40_07805 [bacterium]|nr:hypothetical protein [candidate division CSSED10-310 bacterium]